MSSITNCQLAFSRCFNLTSVDLSEFDFSNNTKMNYMFNDCSKLETLNLSTLDVSKVTDFSYMFNGCSALTDLNINNWNTESATNMLAMFNNCSSLPYIAPSSDGNRENAEFILNTSKVTAMHYMFSGCSSLVKLHPTNWNTSAVTTMSYMFNTCSSLDFVDLAEWDVNAISYASEANNGMYQMFHGCSSLDNDGVNFSKWCVSKFTDEPRNFRTGGVKFVEKPDWGYACENKTPGPISVPPYEYIELTYDRDIAYANTSGYVNRTIFLPFQDYGNGATIEWKDGDVSYIENSIADIDGYTNVDIQRSAGNWSAGSDIVVRIYGDVKQFIGHSSAFKNYRYLSSYVQYSNKALKGVKIVGMSSITNCQLAFSRCFNLTSVDLSEFDFSNNTTMNYMFNDCRNLTSVDFSNLCVENISSATNFNTNAGFTNEPTWGQPC
jgi:surface protein